MYEVQFIINHIMKETSYSLAEYAVFDARLLICLFCFFFIKNLIQKKLHDGRNMYVLLGNREHLREKIPFCTWVHIFVISPLSFPQEKNQNIIALQG